MHSLESIEKRQNVKLPEEYKQLYQSDFKKIKNNCKICVEDNVFCISKFLSATEINDILEEFYDFFGYDIIPIAEVDYDDYICLYYKKNKKNPAIIYWNYELALENPGEGIIVLSKCMHEFEDRLK